MNLRSPLQAATRLLVHSVVGNRWVPPAVIAIFFFGGLLLEFSHRLGHDAGWLLVATGRLVDGADIYVDDVIEFNPPLILYLLSPPVVASRWLGVSEITSFRIYFALLAAASLLLSRGILNGMIPPDRAQARGYLLAVLAAVFMIDVSASYGQREHLMVILLTPYLLVFTARVSNLAVPLRQVLPAAVAGGLAIVVKPHYVVLLPVLELYLAIRRRSLLAWLRPELLTLVGVGISYLLSLLLFIPSYLFFVLPLSLDTYWVYQKPIQSLVELEHLLFFSVAALAVAILRRTPELRELGWVLLLSAVCFYAAFCLQGTDWPYHLIPYRSAVIVAMTLPLLALLGRARFERAPIGAVGSGLATAAVALLTIAGLLVAPKPIRARLQRAVAVWRAGQSFGERGLPYALVEKYAKHGTIYSFTTSVTGGFPLVNYTGVTWSSRFSCLWALAAVISWQRDLSWSASSEERERMAEIERYVVDAVIEDLEKRPPDLVFMDRPKLARRVMGGPFSYREYFLRDDRFRRIWAHYRLLRSGSYVDIYVRCKEGPCPEEDEAGDRAPESRPAAGSRSSRSPVPSPFTPAGSRSP